LTIGNSELQNDGSSDTTVNTSQKDMSQKTDREKNIIDYFQKCRPDFAATSVTCEPGNDPPDFVCTDANGKRIGIELGEWLNEGQMKLGKELETMEASYLSAIQSEKKSPPPNIGTVWIGPKEMTILKKADQDGFCRELYDNVQRVAKEWHTNKEINGPQGYHQVDFSGYPMLQKYLSVLVFMPVSVLAQPQGFPWICFRLHGGAYSSKSAIDALAALLEKKIPKYVGLRQREILSELYLIAYFDQGLLYNTPYETIGIDFSTIAEICREWLSKNPGQFDKVFLFDSTGNGKVEQIY
jgi:hypothetical protein